MHTPERDYTPMEAEESGYAAHRKMLLKMREDRLARERKASRQIRHTQAVRDEFLRGRKREYDRLVSTIPAPFRVPKFNRGGRLVVCLFEFRPMPEVDWVLRAVARVYSRDYEVGLAIVYGRANAVQIERTWGRHDNVALIKLDHGRFSHAEYSALLKQPQLWERLSAWTHVLVYQTDALLMRPVDDAYFAYDYIGAPWRQPRLAGRGGNGGFSLRRVAAMVKTCERYRETPLADIPQSYEDQWFCQQDLCFPSDKELHRAFAVEALPHPAPVGCHKAWGCSHFMSQAEWDGLLAYIERSLVQPCVVVFGHRGWIGGQVVALLERAGGCRVVPAGDVRADDRPAVAQLLDAVRPTHVMAFVGRTHAPGAPTIDCLEAPAALAGNLRDNLRAPLVLAELCKTRHVHYTYLGTGCIYDGPGPYAEEDPPDFAGSAYSAVKGSTDQLMQQLYADSALNLRLRMPVSSRPHPRNLVTKLAGYEYVHSAPNSVSVLDDLLPILVEMAFENRTGTFNLTNPGTITHNELLELYRTYVDPEFTWKTCSADELREKVAAPRSTNSLSTARLEALYPGLADAHSATRAALAKMGAARRAGVER